MRQGDGRDGRHGRESNHDGFDGVGLLLMPGSDLKDAFCVAWTHEIFVHIYYF